MDSVLAAFVMDINRTVRMFKSADHVCLLVGAIASSLDKLLLGGEGVPTGKSDVAGMKAALRNTVDMLYDNEAATQFGVEDNQLWFCEPEPRGTVC